MHHYKIHILPSIFVIIRLLETFLSFSMYRLHMCPYFCTLKYLKYNDENQMHNEVLCTECYQHKERNIYLSSNQHDNYIFLQKVLLTICRHKKWVSGCLALCRWGPSSGQWMQVFGTAIKI